MGALPVVNPADFLPVPLAIEALDYETLVAAWKAQFKTLWPDYNVDALESDPGVIVAEAYAYLRLTDRARVNDAYSALRLARAKGTDLDGLAADRGVKRLVLVPATATAPAIMEGDLSLLLRCWLKMQTWGSGSPWGVEYHARTLGLPLGLADADVIDFPGEGRMTCVVLPNPGTADVASETLRATVGNGLMTRSRRPGAVPIDTVRADMLTVDYASRVQIRRGASQAAAQAAANAAIQGFFSSRRLIGAELPVTAMASRQFSDSVVNVIPVAPLVDTFCLPTQAPQLGNLSIAIETVDG